MTLSKGQLEAHSKHRLRTGERKHDVHQFLVDNGMEPDEAEALVSNLLANLRGQAFNTFLLGGGMAFLGIAVSFLLSGATGGFMVFLWWGPAIFGLIICGNGLWRWMRSWKH